MKGQETNRELQSDGVIIIGKQTSYRSSTKKEQFQSIQAQDQQNISLGELSNYKAKRNNKILMKRILVIAIIAVILAVFALSVIVSDSNTTVVNNPANQNKNSGTFQPPFTQPNNEVKREQNKNTVIPIQKIQTIQRVQPVKTVQPIKTVPTVPKTQPITIYKPTLETQKIKPDQIKLIDLDVTDFIGKIIKLHQEIEKAKAEQQSAFNDPLKVTQLQQKIQNFKVAQKDLISKLVLSYKQKNEFIQNLNSRIADMKQRFVQQEVQKLNAQYMLSIKDPSAMAKIQYTPPQAQPNNYQLAQSLQEVQTLKRETADLKNKLTLSQQELQKTTIQKFQSVQHRLSPLKFTYPTVGVPVPGNLFNSTKVRQQDFKTYDKMVIELLQPYNDTNCQFGRFGDVSEGGYVVCKNFFSQSEALLNIGVNGAKYDKFGCQLTSAFQIPNYLYDCTNNEQPVCPTNNDGNFFSQICVGDQKEKANGFMFYTLKDIIKDHRLTKRHITLKLDTEGGEYAAFKYFPMEDLDYIDQIVMEFHFGKIYPEYWGHIDIMRSLMQKFVVVNFHANNIVCYPGDVKFWRLLTSNANEVCLINKKLITLNSNTRSFALNSHNVPNIGWPDCQLH